MSMAIAWSSSSRHSASISAFVAIWGLLRYLERFSAWIFVFYRVVLGVVILGGLALGRLS